MVMTRSQRSAAATQAEVLRSQVTATKAIEQLSIPKSDVIGSHQPLTCWVDASATRIAILIGNDYMNFTLKKGWQTKTRDINWAETAAFELLAEILIARGQVGRVRVKSDSSTALRAVAGNKVRVREIIDSAQRLNSIVKVSTFTLEGVKVPTKGNLADPFSRGKRIEGYQKMKEIIVVPAALAPFVAVE